MERADFTRKNAIVFLLGAILFLGFILRSSNLNFPSIGYHDMKENEHLGIGQAISLAAGFIFIMPLMKILTQKYPRSRRLFLTRLYFPGNFSAKISGA
jgi:hypothetical protein